MSERRPGERRARGDPRVNLRGRGLLGLVLLLLAGLVGPDGPGWTVRPGGAPRPAPEGRPGRPLGEPLADALAPLGPVKAIVSSALWLALVEQVTEGGSPATVSLSEALLAIHPDLDVVRKHLAQQLIVNEAGRAPDAASHRALVLRGLQMLEDGAVDGRPLVRGALGRLLVERSMADPRFAPVARQYFGEDPVEIAIEELRASVRVERPSPFDVVVLVDLLVSRGLDALDVYDDTFAAERDLREAEALLQTLSAEAATVLAHKLEKLREQWQAAAGVEKPS